MSDAGERALRLAVRARRALEVRRLLRAAARGAVPGAVLGGLAMATSRLLPPPSLMVPLAWALPVAGALTGLLRAAFRGRIACSDAALWLDRALGTRERIVTLLTRPGHPGSARIAAGLPDDLRLPSIPLPRELALVPALLFVLFALGLLPVRVVEAAAGSPRPVAAPAGGAPGAGSDRVPGKAEDARSAEEALAALARGEALDPQTREDVGDLLDRRLPRPEERATAREVLDEAQGGDAAARSRLAGLLREIAGRGGRGEATAGADAAPVAPAARSAADDARARGALAYPEMIDVLRAYRRALAEE